jgi:hypothetical protein
MKVLIFKRVRISYLRVCNLASLVYVIIPHFILSSFDACLWVRAHVHRNTFARACMRAHKHMVSQEEVHELKDMIKLLGLSKICYIIVCSVQKCSRGMGV